MIKNSINKNNYFNSSKHIDNGRSAMLNYRCSRVTALIFSLTSKQIEYGGYEMQFLTNGSAISFTLKRDFNLTAFKIKSKPDFFLVTDRYDSEAALQINKTIEVEIPTSDIDNLINAGKKILVIVKEDNKMYGFNYDELDLLTKVAEC